MWLIQALHYATPGEPTLLEELWEYFEGKYFSVDVGRYEHISVGSGSLITLQKIVLGICIGIIIAAAVACYDKNRLGAFVRAICRSECFSPDRAMTLYDLGFMSNGGVRASLRSPHKLGKVVKCVEKEVYEREVEVQRQAFIEKNGSDAEFFMPAYRINFDEDHFYIPDEEHYRADVRFDNKGSGWRAFILVVVVAVLGAALLCFLLPDILQLVDNMLDILSDNDKVLK